MVFYDVVQKGTKYLHLAYPARDTQSNSDIFPFLEKTSKI